MAGPRPPTVLAFDYGLKRIGVAAGNVITRTAEPVVTLRADRGRPDRDELAACVNAWQPEPVLSLRRFDRERGHAAHKR